MNIKRAKQEIKDSIEAYLTKDDFGEYEIPVIRQRPILLLGAPGIGKTHRPGFLYHYPSYPPERHRSALYFGAQLWREKAGGDGIYHE